MAIDAAKIAIVGCGPGSPLYLTEAARGRYRHIRMHAIEADGWLDDLSTGSKFNTEWTFLNRLKALGREAAEEWLGSCLDSVGVRSSVDLQARFG